MKWCTEVVVTDVGHVTLSDKKYHYYLQDHQGNNRVVVDQTGQKEEVNHYYPFGGMFASADNSIQPYKLMVRSWIQRMD